MKVAIYGGSFDPPHLGHYNLVLKAIQDLEIDKLIVLPNFQNPWKEKTKFSPQKRFSLLQKLFSKFPKVEISSFEIDNGYPTKTIESVQYFSKLYSKIYLIIGADNLAKLELWDDYQEIITKVEFVVAKRGNIKIDKKYKIIDIDFEISSTDLRKSLDLEKIPSEIWEDI